MKNQYILSALLIALVFSFVLPAQAQRRYKNQRVRIKVEKPTGMGSAVETHNDIPSDSFSIDKPVNFTQPVSTTEKSWNEVVVPYAQEDLSATVSIENKVIKAEKQSWRNMVRESMKTAKQKSPLQNIKDAREMLKQLKRHDNAPKLSPEDSKQVQMQRWLLVMIILYAVGLIFLILAIVFHYAVSWPAAVVFYVLFALCWIAATIILILGLVGVMS